MITESYKIAPTNGTDLASLAADGENLLLREQLGLEPLALKDPDAGFFAFRKLTEDEALVYGVLFPQKTKITEYKDFLPNEVLSLYSDFKDTCPYFHIKTGEVWHAKEYDPDPILTVNCRLEDDENTWANTTYLIARWGEALLPYEALMEKALKLWKATNLTKLKKIKREVETRITDLEEAEILLDKSISPTYYSY